MPQEPQACLIQQPDCWRIAADPICAKCGLDERMRYIGEEAALLAKLQAQARYWKKHAEALQAQLGKPPETHKAQRASQIQKYKAGEVFQNMPEAPQMVVLPKGSFLMGTADDERLARSDQSPQHRVYINHTLTLGRYPVTFEDWGAYVADVATAHQPADHGWGRGKRPVINVSWDHAQAYISWLNKKLGWDAQDPNRYRLPSEAEWEYACRAGTTGHFGTPNGEISENIASYEASYVIEALSPKAGKKYDKTTPVGIYAPNPWGLYDMHGNVWEWVQDSYEDSYRGAPNDGGAWETGSASRVLRGGSWNDIAYVMRSAFRNWIVPDYRSISIGFRLAKTES